MNSSTFLAGFLVEFKEVWPTIVYILGGTGMTCVLIVGAMLLGLFLGTIMASMEAYGPGWMRWLVHIYVWFFRGVPILLLVFMFHFGLAGAVEEYYGQLARWGAANPEGFLNLVLQPLFKMQGKRLIIPPVFTAVFTLGMCSAAYQSQIFRGAINSLPDGQLKAARALGMSTPKAVINIILPQALRISIPAWSNEYSILLKDSAVVYIIGVIELMATCVNLANATYQSLLFYSVAGLVYYILTVIGVRFLNKLYKKLLIPGLAHETLKAEG